MQPADHDLTATILHVSDPQFGQYHRFTSDDSLAGHLLGDLDKLASLGARRIDLVIISGDIAEQGKRAEYDQALAFVDQLLPALDLSRERLVVVPGNHDVSWDLCRAHFAECSADDIEPRPPYDKKWRHYREFVTELHGPAAFTEERPYRLHRFDDLRLVVAAMNSTMEESHEQHFGLCGRDQLRWFAGQLAQIDGMARIGVLHHNARRRARADNENLRDEDDLTGIVADRLDLLLHGHTHQGKEDRLADDTLVLATGSAAVTANWRPDEVPNQYQVIELRPDGLTRWARQWDAQSGRWIADARASQSGNDATVRIRLDIPGWPRAGGSHPDDGRRGDGHPDDGRRGDGHTDDAHRGGRRGDSQPGDGYPRDGHSGGGYPLDDRDRYGRLGRADGFAAQVEAVTRLDLPGDHLIIERRDTLSAAGRRLDYLLAFPLRAPLRCVGIVDGRADLAAIDALDERVFGPLRPRGAVEFVVVHHGPDDPDLRATAGERGIRVKTWTEYNDLLETGAYRAWLGDELRADRLYPQDLYQPQRYRTIDRFGRAAADASDDLLSQVYQAVLAEDGQFVLILGEAGYGKSFLVRRLAHVLLGNEHACLTPIVVYLRDRDKRESLDELVSAALLPSRAPFHADRFRHSLDAGTLALLIDGYDEFAVRVGYASAAAQLRTFTDALGGRAKVLLTTRPSHFSSTDEVTSKLFASIRSVHQGRVYQLEPFDAGQQRAFLHRWFELAGEDDPADLAGRWMLALAGVDNLPDLARTPRMLSFIVEDLSLGELRQAAGQGTVTAAALYQKLVERWLTAETVKVQPDAPSTFPAGKRQELLEDLALRLWRAGERDITEYALKQTARDVLDLPKLELTLDQAAQEFGARTLLKLDGQRRRFAHQSVQEFLLASGLAGLLRAGQGDDLLGEAQLSGLTIRFLRDLAPQEATAWLERISGASQ